MANWLDAFEQRGLIVRDSECRPQCCSKTHHAGHPGELIEGLSLARPLAIFSTVCVGRGDINLGIGCEPPAQLMPTTSCAIAATRVWAAETTP